MNTILNLVCARFYPILSLFQREFIVQNADFLMTNLLTLCEKKFEDHFKFKSQKLAQVRKEFQYLAWNDTTICSIGIGEKKGFGEATSAFGHYV